MSAVSKAGTPGITSVEVSRSLHARFLDRFRVSINHCQVGAHRALGAPAPLLPFLQRAWADSVAPRELRLRQAQLGADRPHIHILWDLDVPHGKGRPSLCVVDNFLHRGNQTLTDLGVLGLCHWTPFKRFTSSFNCCLSAGVRSSFTAFA